MDNRSVQMFAKHGKYVCNRCDTSILSMYKVREERGFEKEKEKKKGEKKRANKE